MEIQRQNGTLSVRDLRDLSAANASTFRDRLDAALAPDLQCIEIDLSQLNFVDSGGVGALVSLYQSVNAKRANGVVTLRLLHPQPSVRQMFELTRTHHWFEIVPADALPK